LFHKKSHGIHNQYWYLIRLAQHAHDASTAQAVTRFLRDRHHDKIQPVRFPARAGTAARPYAEIPFKSRH